MMRTLLLHLGALSVAQAMVMPTTNVSGVNATGDACTGDCLMMRMMEEKRLHFAECRAESKLTHGAAGCPTILPSTSTSVPCEGGQSGEYACSGVDLLSYVGMEDLGSSETNDIWGWTDPEFGNEIALVSLFDGTAFVDVTDAVNPIVLGKLDTHTIGSDWGDIKVYDNIAYIGSEAVDHGMQIHDLLTLREFYGKKTAKGTVRSIPEQLHYDGFGRSHNIVLNEASGFLYAVGSRQGADICDGGPHIVDIRAVRAPDGSLQPPTYVGCYGADGYTHDAEVVIYSGPDEEFRGREIMFGYNTRGNTLTIIDMTDHTNPEIIGSQTYDAASYTHQGWLSEDQTHLFLDGKFKIECCPPAHASELMSVGCWVDPDEADERRALPTGHTRTLTWDVTDLRNPTLVHEFFSEETVRPP